MGEAIHLACWAHRGQKRKHLPDVDYIVHPMAVLSIVSMVSRCPAARCASVLHDVLEDCGEQVSSDFIRRVFGWEVTTMVHDLSRRDGEGDVEYRNRLSGLGPVEQTIKAADLLDNTANGYDLIGSRYMTYFKACGRTAEVLERADPGLRRAMDERFNL